MRVSKKTRPALMALALMLLLTGCTNRPACLPPEPVTAPRIPPLPSEARQQPAPLWCSPTCSAGLIQERENWLKLTIDPE